MNTDIFIENIERRILNYNNDLSFSEIKAYMNHFNLGFKKMEFTDDQNYSRLYLTKNNELFYGVDVFDEGDVPTNQKLKKYWFTKSELPYDLNTENWHRDNNWILKEGTVSTFIFTTFYIDFYNDKEVNQNYSRRNILDVLAKYLTEYKGIVEDINNNYLEFYSEKIESDFYNGLIIHNGEPQ